MTNYGVKALRKILLLRESTAGVASTQNGVYWRGEGTISNDLSTVFPSEDIGILGGVDRSYIPQLAASLALSETPATFEQLPYFGEMGVKSTTGGTSDGAGSDYIYDYLFATTSQNSVAAYTVQGGDNVLMEQALFAYCSEFTLSGKPNEAVMMSGTLNMRSASTIAAFSSSAAIPTVEEILFNKGKLYIDAVNGTLGGTTAIATFAGFDLSVKTGFQGIFTADGQLYFTFVKQTKPVITLDLTWEMDSVLASAERAAWLAGTPRKIRMDFAGSALTTTGTLFGTKLLRLDLAGKYSKFSELKDDNGDDLITASFNVSYDSTAALYADMKIVNQLTSIAT